MAVALRHPPQGSRAARAQQRLRTAEAHQSVHALLLHGVVTYRRRLHHAARLRRLARGPQLLLVALLAPAAGPSSGVRSADAPSETFNPTSSQSSQPRGRYGHDETGRRGGHDEFEDTEQRSASREHVMAAAEGERDRRLAEIASARLEDESTRAERRAQAVRAAEDERERRISLSTEADSAATAERAERQQYADSCVKRNKSADCASTLSMFADASLPDSKCQRVCGSLGIDDGAVPRNAQRGAEGGSESGESALAGHLEANQGPALRIMLDGLDLPSSDVDVVVGGLSEWAKHSI